LSRLDQPGEVRIWNIADGRELQRLQGHARYVSSVAFSPDGRLLASGGGDNIVKVWDISTDKELLALRGHTEEIRSVAFSPDSQRLASGSDDHTVRIWDLTSAEGHRYGK
jgi:WD40 repeat protein